MKEFYKLETLEQLKALSDPVRMKIMWEIVEEAQTGKMIGDALDIPANKIHYHLNLLEKAGIIEVTRTEVKNGIVQKFFRPIAKAFLIDHLLQKDPETAKGMPDMYKENVILQLEKTSHKVMTGNIDLNTMKHNMFGSIAVNEQQLDEIREKLNEVSRLIMKYQTQEGSEEYPIPLLFSSVALTFNKEED